MDFSNFSINPGYTGKIPLNPPLRKGEVTGMPRLIEKLRILPVKVLFAKKMADLSPGY
jgi:hypothetical protein